MGEKRRFNPNISGELRRLAEETISHKSPGNTKNLDSLSSDEARRLLHELQVHHVELEIQNEELRRAQLELEVSHARYFDLYDLAPVGYVTLDEWGLIREANLTAARLLGMERSGLLKEPLTRFIAREDQDKYYLQRKQLLQTQGQKAWELRMVKKDGSLLWARLEMSLMNDHENRVPVCRMVIMNVTDRKQAEEMLQEAHLQLEQKVIERTAELEKANNMLELEITKHSKAALALLESEEHFRRIVEIMPIAIFAHTESGVIFANTAAAKLTNMTSPHDLVGQSLLRFLHTDDKELFNQNFMDMLAEKIDTKTFPARLVTESGEVINVAFFLTPFTHQNEPAVHIVADNITQRKKMNEEILKADKLESISILAGGIAHDFNNYLATLLGNITLGMLYTDKQDKVYKYLANMEKATLRVKVLTQQLFTFAQGGVPLKKTAHINKLITESTNFALSGSNVCCQVAFTEDLHPVEIDEGQITQVLFNIIINAAQAMPDGGTISIDEENVTIGMETGDHHFPLPDGEYVKISIKDEGPGIPEELLMKIFDPFFSTKQGGSGLGLATSYSIIKNHDGFIQAESEMGKGATLTIYLPASANRVSIKMEDDDIIYGEGKILVMDDEEDIRDVMGEIISSLGYEAHFAKDGTEAIATYLKAKKTGRPFDIVVMDLTIPGGMGGKEAIEKMRKKDPAVKAIVSSGYSDDPVMANYEEYGFNGVLKKPYTVNEVSNAIHEIMNQS